ncbi:DUF1800 domain-containing protein [Roseiconus nitratireducens]|uniref:DUF1800 domain-containing protein n=1 Tax=Roseiconus nitratireducens TaxID=2605748 RepID=A0A5M6DGS5_9BACT|nr:DUF1800 family protein [Roseiconus nitratireducens]KAA5544435.1 DUF1800 domain-containing protein [Roseiconus nitratireducens]
MPVVSRGCWRFLFGILLAGCWIPATLQAGTFEVESRRDLAVMKRKILAAQFLSRATFGPTIETIEALAERMGQIGTRRACEEWIDRQMDLPPSLHRPLIIDMVSRDGFTTTQDNAYIQRYRYHAWWHNALAGEDQLRQRVAWALSQILVTSEDGAGFNDRNPGHHSGQGRWIGPSSYYDLMVRHAFGNYRELLEDVTYHPVMGVYLSHMRNRKTDVAANRFPDENYAREIMQLFTIGLYELRMDGLLKVDGDGNLIPTYDNETIKEFAKIFTGLAFKPHPNATGTGRFYWGNDLEAPMEMFDFEHEPGTKTLLGGQVVGSDEIVDGEADIDAALDNLMAHDNVAPFIARRLIQRLVKSNPSRAYIYRVARTFNDNGQGVKGDLGAVVKAVLLDPELWRGQRLLSRRDPYRVEVVVRGTDFSSLSEPVIRYTRLLRGLHATSSHSSGRMMLMPMDYSWSQEPYRSPTVFNFYLPDYQPPGDLLGYTPPRRVPNGFLAAPEFQIKTPVTSNRLAARYIWDISSQRSQQRWSNNSAGYSHNSDLYFDLEMEKAWCTEDEDMHRLMDHLDLVFCYGSMPEDYQEAVVQKIASRTAWMKNNATWRPDMEDQRAESAIIATVLTPFAAITD